MVTHILALVFAMGPQLPQQCTYSADCGANECVIYEEGRFVCETKQVGIAVYDFADIEKIEALKGARVTCPLDSEGQPVTSKCALTGAKVTFKPGHTFHYEIKNRGE